MRTVTVGDQILNIRSNEIPHQSWFLTIRQQGGWVGEREEPPRFCSCVPSGEPGGSWVAQTTGKQRGEAEAGAEVRGTRRQRENGWGER